MSIRVPTKAFLTKGNGVHREKLTSFEYALRDAGIEAYNLVTVSSILPPHATVISRDDGVRMLEEYRGGIVHCVMSRADTNEANRLVVAANGLAVPTDRAKYGYISEHHNHGQNQKDAGDYAEDLAVGMLGTTLGIEVDVDRAWNEQKQEYMLSGGIVRAQSIAQGAIGRKDLWTTVLTAVVFCDYR